MGRKRIHAGMMRLAVVHHGRGDGGHPTPLVKDTAPFIGCGSDGAARLAPVSLPPNHLHKICSPIPRIIKHLHSRKFNGINGFMRFRWFSGNCGILILFAGLHW
jgi:hypothetical protein